MKVLVVEDDKIAQLGIKKILSAGDLSVELVLAENGKEGVDYFDKAEAAGTDFVLLDLNMPVMNGFEFLETIRNNEKLKDLPVVVHTTSDNKDNGIGIPKESAHRVFEIFQKLNNNKDSNGVGMSIVKKIVQTYGGKIWFESEVGKGTTFKFNLPRSLTAKA